MLRRVRLFRNRYVHNSKDLPISYNFRVLRDLKIIAKAMQSTALIAKIDEYDDLLQELEAVQRQYR